MRKIAALLTGILLVFTPFSGPRTGLHFFAAEAASKARPPVINPLDVSIFEQKLPLAEAESSLAQQTLAVAKSFMGVPYVNGTLEAGPDETLVVNLRELDCWTFVENSLAIALAARSSDRRFDDFVNQVQQLRYWGGQVDGYTSRIHYFSGWLLQAEKLGYLTDLTPEMGGTPYRKPLGYMTARPKKYPALCVGDNCKALRTIEQRISHHEWFFISKKRVAQMEHLLREGDIIAITSAKPGLDVAHQGFAVRKNGRIHLMHASSLQKRVMLSGLPLPQYLASQKGQTGIIVARLAE